MSIMILAFSSGGETLLSVDSQRVTAWDTFSGRVISTLSVSENEPFISAVLIENGNAALLGAIGSLCRWDFNNSWGAVTKPMYDGYAVTSINVSYDGQSAICSGATGGLTLFSVSDGSVINEIFLPGDYPVITDVAINQDGTGSYYIIQNDHATGEKTDGVYFWDFYDDKADHCIYSFYYYDMLSRRKSRLWKYHTPTILSPSGEYLAIFADKNVGLLIELKTGAEVKTFWGDCAAFSLNGGHTVLQNGKNLNCYEGNVVLNICRDVWCDQDLLEVALSNEGNWLAAQTRDNNLLLWDLRNEAPPRKLIANASRNMS